MNKPLIIWGAGSAVVVAGAALALWWSTGEAEAAAARAAQLAERHRAAVTAGALDAEAAVAAESAAGAAMRERLAVLEREVPAIAPAWLEADLVASTALVQSEAAALRQRSDRSRIPIPAALPFQNGLDQDPVLRLRQLAQLHAAKTVVGLCLDAQVRRVVALTPGRSALAATPVYAQFAGGIELEADWAAAARLLDAVSKVDGSANGVTFASWSMDPPVSGMHRIRASYVQTLRTDPAWRLGDKAAGAGARPASGGRLGRAAGGGNP